MPAVAGAASHLCSGGTYQPAALVHVHLAEHSPGVAVPGVDGVPATQDDSSG